MVMCFNACCFLQLGQHLCRTCYYNQPHAVCVWGGGNSMMMMAYALCTVIIQIFPLLHIWAYFTSTAALALQRQSCTTGTRHVLYAAPCPVSVCIWGDKRRVNGVIYHFLESSCSFKWQISNMNSCAADVFMKWEACSLNTWWQVRRAHQCRKNKSCVLDVFLTNRKLCIS